MSRRRARNQIKMTSGYETSLVRTFVAAAFGVLGIAWLAVYTNFAMDAAKWVEGLGERPATKFGWMADLGDWNYLIGFGLILIGLMISAHPKTPLGRGRGVVIGMLGSFLIGLVWVISYYFLSQESVDVPLLTELGQWNLAVGVGFLAAGFAFATRWE